MAEDIDLSGGMVSKSNLGSLMQYVPEFERPIANTQTLVNSSASSGAYNADAGSVAHVAPFASKTDTNKVYIDDPNNFTPPDLAHELVHQIQRQAGSQVKQVNTAPILAQKNAVKQKALYDATYGYGGAQGAKNLKSISTLNTEQQGNLVSDYMKQYTAGMQEGVSDPDAMDKLNAAYQRPLQQLANMARSGNTIDTIPAAPGPPPSGIAGSGLVKPLAQIGAALPSWKLF